MANPPKTRRPLGWLRSRPRLLGGLVLAVLALLFGTAGVLVGSWSAVCRDCPSVAQIYVWEPKQATKVLAHDGSLIAELFRERRTPVPVASLPDYVPQAFIAVEDKRFYDHDGFDARGLVRGVINLALGRPGGGSTITQQLARNMFEEQIGFERRVERKLKELRVAYELERVYSKDQILEAYINQINFERGWWGIETAAQRYFGKPAAEMEPEEAALLAAVIKLPGHYSPFRNPSAALQRRNLVLGLMAQQGYIPRESLDSLRTIPVPSTPQGVRDGDFAPYFVEWVRSALDQRFGADLYERGLRVYTTLDPDMQRLAEQAMNGGWDRIESQPGYRHPKYDEVIADGGTTGTESAYVQGMFVAMDPGTGEVRALVGGRDFADSKFNRATQARRQPGSVFKPFVYTAAVSSGMSASHIVYDAPIRIEQVGSEPWTPRNFDREFNGPTTIREALKRSLNLVAVKVGMEVGIETVVQFAQRMGITTEIPRYPSTTIGAADVIPLEIVSAYAPLVRDGARVRPRAILRVEDATGRVLLETAPDRIQVVDTLAAAIVRSMLVDVVNGGTGYTARAPGLGNLSYDVPAAGKTGTTNDATDVWFIGFTPDLLAGVWFGFDRPTRITNGATGGAFAAPVWGSFMRTIYQGQDALREVPEPWSLPPGLTTRRVDQRSGKLASEWCPQELAYTEIYIPGTEPNEPCHYSDTGLLGRPAGVGDPDEDAESDSLRVNRRFRF